MTIPMIEMAIEEMEKTATTKVQKHLINYLRANVEDIQEAFEDIIQTNGILPG